jgi:hypothetical protein
MEYERTGIGASSYYTLCRNKTLCSVVAIMIGRRSFELIFQLSLWYSDLQLKPYRTDEFVHKLYYETSRFSAFNNQFVVKARINNHQRDPVLSVERQITYQVKYRN